MAGPSVSNVHIASQLRQTRPAANLSPIDTHQEYAPVAENAFLVWKKLKQHAQFTEFYWQIYECLKADDDVWCYFRWLRENPRADGLFITLGISSLKMVPPSGIWSLLVHLRSAPNWHSIRQLILGELDQTNMVMEAADVAARDSNVSQRSNAHLSVASQQSSRFSSASSMSNGSFVHIESNDHLTAQAPPWPIPENKPLPKPPRMAPEGYRFVCPHRQCKDKFAFKKLGAYENHISTKHPQDREHDASQHLRSEHSLHGVATPMRTEVEDHIDTEQGSDGSYPEKKALSDGTPTATGHEYRPTHGQPNDLQHPSNYFRKTGVHSMNYENEAAALAASYVHPDNYNGRHYSLDSPMSQY